MHCKIFLMATVADAGVPIRFFTQLAEEPHCGKLWNLVFGTDYPIRVLSAGQNIPGNFVGAAVVETLAKIFSPTILDNHAATPNWRGRERAGKAPANLAGTR